MSSHHASCRRILILSYHVCLGLRSGFFPPALPTKALYTPLLFPICFIEPISSIYEALNRRAALAQSQGSSRESKVGKTDTGTGFLEHFFFPSNFHSISVS